MGTFSVEEDSKDRYEVEPIRKRLINVAETSIRRALQ